MDTLLHFAAEDKEQGTVVLDWIQTQGVNILVIILISWFAYHFINIFITRFVERIVRKTSANNHTSADIKKRRETLDALLSTISRIFIIIVSGIMIIHQLFPGINFAPLLASAGIVGVAIGFGAQSLIKDFLTGIFIMSENQYRVGDVVDIEGAAGTVERFGIRSTSVRDADGNVHYIPNGSIIHVINKTMGYSKVNFTIAVEPDTDIDLLAAVINETGKKLASEEKWASKILEAPKFLNIGTFSQLGMEVTVTGKTEPSEQWSVSGEMRRRLLPEFRKHKIHLAQLPNAPAALKKR